MPYALTRTVKSWIASASGTTDPVELLERINAIRRELYSWYQSINLFVDVEECFEVQRFCYDCNQCHDCYSGITLPRYFAAVEAMWFNDAPVRLSGRWRQWHEGIGPICECGLRKDDIADNFCTERDLAPCQASRLRVVALDAADNGKIIVLRGQSTTGPKEIEFKMNTVPQMTDEAFNALDRPGGVSKEVTVGRVVLADESGRILSIYDPTETVPAYKRIKISGLPDGRNFVNLRAARNYVDVTDDLDVCETDNQRAWEAMARYLRLNRKTDRTREDMQSEASYIVQARELLLGDKARMLGKSTRSEVRFATPQMSSHSLRRTGRR